MSELVGLIEKPYEFVIYRLVSPSGKCYIGLTRDFRARWHKHISDWNVKKVGGCVKLCNAFNKYHPNLWEIYFIYTTTDFEDAKKTEIEYILFYDSINNGYNILLGGDVSRPGRKVPQEIKDKISKSHMGIKPSDETRKKISEAKKGKPSWWTGKKHTEETKQKIRDFKLNNYICTDAHREALSRANSGVNNPNYGKKHSEETRRKIGEKQRLYQERKRLNKEANQVCQSDMSKVA